MSLPLAKHFKPLVEAIAHDAVPPGQGLEFTLIVPSESHFWNTVQDAGNMPPSLLELYQQLSVSSPSPGSKPLTAIDILPSALKLVAVELNFLKKSSHPTSSRDGPIKLLSKRFCVQACGFAVSFRTICLLHSDSKGGRTHAPTSEKDAVPSGTRSVGVQWTPEGIEKTKTQGSAKSIGDHQELRSTALGDVFLDHDELADLRNREIERPGRATTNRDHVQENDPSATPALINDEHHIETTTELERSSEKIRLLQKRVEDLCARNEKQRRELVSRAASHEKEVFDLTKRLERSETRAEDQTEVILSFKDETEDLRQHGITQDEELVARNGELQSLQRQYDYLKATVSDIHTTKTQGLEEEVSDLRETIDALKEKSRRDDLKASEYVDWLKRCGKRITLLTLKGLKVADLKVKCEEMGIGPRDVPKLHADLVDILMCRIVSADEKGDKQGHRSHFLKVALEEGDSRKESD